MEPFEEFPSFSKAVSDQAERNLLQEEMSGKSLLRHDAWARSLAACMSGSRSLSNCLPLWVEVLSRAE